MTADTPPHDPKDSPAEMVDRSTHGPLTRAAIRLALFAACAAVLSAGAYYRLHRITTEGIHEGDTVGYYTLAKRWASGDRTYFLGDQFYRPVIYWINELSLRGLGDNDYSIKAVTGAFDVANILLILLIARHLSGSLLPGLAAGLLYALLPYEIEMCRSGMPHAISGTFVLLALFLFRPRSRCTAPDPLRLLHDAAAGFALGLAMNTHAELGFLGFGFVACQAMQVFSTRRDGRSLAWFTLRAAAITLATLAPYGIGILIFGYEKVHRILSTEIGIGAFSPKYVESAPLYRVPLDVLTVSSSFAYGNRWWIPAFVVIPPLAWCLHRRIAREGRAFSAYTPWLLVLSYALVFPVIIGPFDRTHARIFLPILPLTLIAAACALFSLAYPRHRFSAAALLAVAAALVLVVGPNAAKGQGYFHSGRFGPSVYRSAYDVIGKRVDARHRLLILPSSAYRDSGFRLPLYFGENVEYLAEQPRSEPYTAELLGRLAAKQHLSYFLLSGQLDFRVLDPKWTPPDRIPAWMTGPAYDLATEHAIIGEFLSTHRAHLIARQRSADLYSTQKRAIFPNSLFEQGNLEGWHVIGFEPMFAPARNRGENGPSPFRIDTRLNLKYPPGLPTETETSGELFCDPFTISEDLIGMLLAGENDPESIHAALRVAGKELRVAPGSPGLTAAQWDVSEYRGERAQLIIRDRNPSIAQGISIAGFYYVF